ncbi:MAG: hypothetical protein ACI4HI_01495 [Lachnospiraceae bacterium]
MKKIKIAVCDTDTSYVEALLEYFMQQTDKKAEFSVFTSPQAYAENEKPMDLALLAEPFWELRGKEDVAFFFSEGEVPPEVQEEEVILKYQEAGEILRQLFFGWQKHQKETQSWRSFGHEKQIIGVYAPGGHEMQLPFSVLLGKELAREKKVLYLNLMECSGLSCFLQEEWKKDLSDLAAMLLHNRGGFAQQLESVLYSYDGLSYVPPMKNPANLYEVSGATYEALLTRILEETDYEVLLLDLGSMLPGFYDLVEKLDFLYCMTKKGRLSQAQQQEFLDCMQMYDSELCARIQPVELCVQERLQGKGSSFLEQLEYTELGDFVRNLVQRGGSYGTDDDTGIDAGNPGYGAWQYGHALRDCG